MNLLDVRMDERRCEDAAMPCVVCGRVNRTRWRVAVPAESTRRKEVTLGITRCRRCGHVYQCPQVQGAWGEAYFDDAYAHAGQDNPYYDPSLKLQHARDLLSALRAYHPDAQRLLEVGAGMGAFISVAQQAGLNVVGTERSEMAVRKAKELFGVSLHLGPVETLPDRHRFDTVVLWDVIEHCPRPDLLIAALSCRLCVAGKIVLTTANYESAARLFSGDKWDMWHPDHYHYFCPSGISRLGKPCGLGNLAIDHAPRIRYPAKKPEKTASTKRFFGSETLTMTQYGACACPA
jgi:SAM-dependent methyltransferase